MSDNINSIIAQPIGIDPAKSMTELQALRQAQASTALTQQQVQGAALGNQLSALQLSRTGWLYGLAGVPGAGGGATQSASAASPATAPAVAGAGAASGGGGSYLPPAQTDGSSGQAAPAAAAPMDYSGRLGQERLGVALPPILAASVLTAQNPTAELKTAVETRRQALYSSLNVPPSQFPAAVDSALRAGWITPAQAQMAENNPGIQQQLLSSFATPEAHLSAATSLSGQGMRQDASTGEIVADPNAIGAAGQRAQATSAGGAAGELPYAGPKAQATALGSAAAETVEVPQPIGPPGPDGKPTYLPVRVNKATLAGATGGNGGGSSGGYLGPLGGPIPNPAPPPGSDGGLGSYAPPGTGQSGPTVPAAAGALPLPTQPIAAPASGQLPVVASAPPVGTPAAAGALPATHGAAQPMLGGLVAGAPALTPTQSAQLEVQKDQAKSQNTSDITSMTGYRADATKAAQTAVATNTIIDQMRNEGAAFDHGSFTDAYQGVQKDIGSIAQALGGSMPASVGSWEAFNKNAGQLARSAASQLSDKVGVQELSLVQKYLPSAAQSAQAFSRIADQIQGVNDFAIAKNAAAANFTGRPAQFEATFNQNVSPAAFIVNRMSAPDAAALATSMKATPDGRSAWAHIMAGAQYAHDNGLFTAAGSGG